MTDFLFKFIFLMLCSDLYAFGISIQEVNRLCTEFLFVVTGFFTMECLLCFLMSLMIHSWSIIQEHITKLGKISKAEFAFQYLLQLILILTAPLHFWGDVHNDKKMLHFIYKVVVRSSTFKIYFMWYVEDNLFVERVKNEKHLFLTIYSCFLIFVDHTALLWSIETGKCLVKYVGHVGSGKIRACCENWDQTMGGGNGFWPATEMFTVVSLAVCQHH